METLTFLGTGSGWPSADRYHTSLLLESDGRRWLIDAGEPCSHRLKVLGIPLASIEAVFLSHGHSDHLSGLPMFIQGCWLEGRTRLLSVYAPAELIGPIEAWLEAVYLPARLIGFPIEYHAWEAQPERTVSVDDGRMVVSAEPTTHLHGLRARIAPEATDRFLAYSLAFTWLETGQRFVFSADLGCPDDLDAALSVPCDLLVCELAHFSPSALFGYLRDKPIRQLCLTHLNPRSTLSTDETRELAVRSLPQVERTIVVSDGQQIEF